MFSQKSASIKTLVNANHAVMNAVIMTLVTMINAKYVE